MAGPRNAIYLVAKFNKRLMMIAMADAEWTVHCRESGCVWFQLVP